MQDRGFRCGEEQHSRKRQQHQGQGEGAEGGLIGGEGQQRQQNDRDRSRKLIGREALAEPPASGDYGRQRQCKHQRHRGQRPRPHAGCSLARPPAKA